MWFRYSPIFSLCVCVCCAHLSYSPRNLSFRFPSFVTLHPLRLILRYNARSLRLVISLFLLPLLLPFCLFHHILPSSLIQFYVIKNIRDGENKGDGAREIKYSSGNVKLIQGPSSLSISLPLVQTGSSFSLPSNSSSSSSLSPLPYITRHFSVPLISPAP